MKPHIGQKKTLTCTGRDFGIVKSESNTPSEYQEPPNGEWWGPFHPDFGTSTGDEHAVGMVQPTLHPKFREPIYKTGLTSLPKFLNWYNTDPRPLNKAAKTPINMEVPIELELTYDANGWTYDAGNGFFPLDKKGFHTGSTSTFHNYHFTMECQMRFLYQGGEVFEFNGDDDVWVFIDQKLVIDLGGMHAPMTGSVALDTLTDLVQGQAYDLSLFHAERHADDSHFRMTTSLEAPPIRKLCTKATTTFPKNQFHAMLGMTQFPIDHAYLTRNTCGGNVYNTNLIPSTGPSFSADCAKVPSAELVYALNKARGGSQSPIAKEKEVLMVTVIDEVGDMYVVLQGGAMPTGTQNLFVVDVGIDTGTSGTNPTAALQMLHSPGIGGSALGEFDTTKIKGEMQRLSLVWGDTGQTSGVIAGPFQGIGVCVSVNVIEQGKVETFAVGSMDATTGVFTKLPIDPLAMKTGGVSICAHGCDDPCAAEDHNDCKTCKSDSKCGWAFNKGCFDLASGITGVSNKGSCVDPNTPAPRVGPNGQTGYGPADMFDTPSASTTGNGGNGMMGLDLGVVVVVLLIATVVGCCCLGFLYVWCCRSSGTTKKPTKKKKTKGPPNTVAIQMSAKGGLANYSNPMQPAPTNHARHARTETQLPEGWQNDFDAQGYKFYRNGVTGEVTWDAPAGSKGGSAALSAALAAAQASTGHHSKQQSVLPVGWSVDKDINGDKFYVSDAGEVSWEKPLKQGWVEEVDANGHPFYTETVTGVHQWDRPV